MQTHIDHDSFMDLREIDRTAGLHIAQCLGLKFRDGICETAWGPKSAIGLARVVRNILTNAKNGSN